MICRLVFLFIFLISSVLFAKTKHREFSAADFQKLSHQDQREFISELRSIVTGMSRDPGLFSQFLKKWNFLLEINPFSEAEAKSDPLGRTVHNSEIVYRSSNVKSDEDGIGFSVVMMDEFRRLAAGKTVIGDREAQHAQRAISTLYGESIKLLLKGGNDPTKKEEIRSKLQAIVDELNHYSFERNCQTPGYVSNVIAGVNEKLNISVRIPRFQQTDATATASYTPAPMVVSSGAVREAPVSPGPVRAAETPTLAGRQSPAETDDRPVRISMIWTPPEVKVAPKPQRVTSPPPEVKASVQSVASVEKVTTAPKEKAGTYDFSACMFGGFILKTEVCRAPRELPENFVAAKIFDAKKFKCPAGELICNPVLFGFEWPEVCDSKKDDMKNCFEQALPVCTSNNVRATANCKVKTKSQKYLDRAVALLKQSPKLLDQMILDFRQLCSPGASAKNRFVQVDSNGQKRSNSDYYQKDTESTCAEARTRWSEVSEKYQQRVSGAGSGGAESSSGVTGKQ